MTKNNPQASPLPSANKADAKDKSSTLSQQAANFCKEIWTKNVNTQSNVRVVNTNELTSISALIAYVAYNLGEPEMHIEQRLSDKFNIPNVTRLPSDHYEDAIRFLVDNATAINKE